MMSIAKILTQSAVVKFLYCLMSFGLFYVSQSSKYYLYEALDGALLINMPDSWVFHGELSKLRKFNPSILYIGRDAANGCFIEDKKTANLNGSSMYYYLSNELASVKAKNPGAIILSKQLDLSRNSIIISYKLSNVEQEYYFSHVVFIRSRRHIILNFKGVDTHDFRAEVNAVIKNAIVKNN